MAAKIIKLEVHRAKQEAEAEAIVACPFCGYTPDVSDVMVEQMPEQIMANMICPECGATGPEAWCDDGRGQNYAIDLACRMWNSRGAEFWEDDGS